MIITPDVHTFADGIMINRSIPRTMTVDGLHYLGKIARCLAENAVIVEIGPLYGSSTWVLAKNSPRGARIYSIDTWAAQDWIPRRLPDALPFGIDAFKCYVRDCPNVIPIQGWSPDVVQDWDAPIDLLFDDATHGDPGFSKNIDFFSRFLKNDGIIAGDDYASGWPDIIQVVNRTALSWGVEPEVCGRVWSMPYKGMENTRASAVADVLAAWTDCDVRLSVRTLSGQEFLGVPRMWCGRMHSMDPVVAMKVGLEGKGIKGVVRAKTYGNDAIIEAAFDDWLDAGGPIAGFSVKLLGEDRATHDICYQACQILEPARDGRRSLNSRVVKNGTWLLGNENVTASALRVFMSEKAEH